MGLKGRVGEAVKSVKEEVTDAKNGLLDQPEIKQAREALARRKLPPDERAIAKARSETEKAERKANHQAEAQQRAREVQERAAENKKQRQETAEREKATLRRDGWLLGSTQPLDGARIPNVCKVVLDPDGIKVAQNNRWVLNLPWGAVWSVEVEDASTSSQRTKTRQRLGHMGGIFKHAQFVPVAETQTITQLSAEMLIKSDQGNFYLQLSQIQDRRLKGWLMGTQKCWKDAGSKPPNSDTSLD